MTLTIHFKRKPFDFLSENLPSMEIHILSWFLFPSYIKQQYLGNEVKVVTWLFVSIQWSGGKELFTELEENKCGGFEIREPGNKKWVITYISDYGGNISEIIEDPRLFLKENPRSKIILLKEI